MTFNVAYDPWVPVLGATGSEVLSLRDTLLRAHELHGLSGTSGLEDVAILRLLGAIVATVEPNNDKPVTEWWKAWEAGKFDSNAYSAYFATHRDEFDLFGDRPFMQVAQPPKDRERNAAPDLYKLILSAPTPGRNPGNSTPAPEVISPARAVRELLTLLSWDAQGGKMNDLGKKGEYALYRTLPSDGGAFTLLGRNLKQTILLNTPFAERKHNDLPVWDATRWKGGTRPTVQPKRGQKAVTPGGIVSYLTWPTRNVKLYADADGNVNGVFVGYGWRFRQAANIPDLEPSCGWRMDPKLGTLTAGFRRDQGVWSGIPKATGFTTAETAEGAMPAASVRWLSELVSSGNVDFDESLVSGYRETIIVFDKNAAAVYGSAVRHLDINESVLTSSRASALASIADSAERVLGSTLRDLVKDRVLAGDEALKRRVTSAYQASIATAIRERIGSDERLDTAEWRSTCLAVARETLDSVAGVSVRPGNMLAFATKRRQLDEWRKGQ